MLLALYGNAQTTAPGLGSWTVLNLRGKIKGRFNFTLETQTRSLKFYNQFFYYEYKGGVSYNINNTFTVFAGVGKYNTYTAGGNFKRPMLANEVRSWFEATMKQNVSRFFFEHRYRIEQRFFTTGYRNRFRYRLALAVPLNKPTLGYNTFYLSTFNELFLTNNAPFFERNRFYIGAGYRFSLLTLQLGWVNQFDYKPSIATNKNFLQLTLGFEIRKKSDSPAVLPFNED